MPISEFQRSQLSKLFDKYFPESTSWGRRDAFLLDLADVFKFQAQNETQDDLYAVLKEYEYVLKSLHELGRKVQAIKFARQLNSDRYNYAPNLYDSKSVVDHFWVEFDNSPAGM